MFLGQFVIKNAKKALEHFLKGPNWTNFENRENTDIAGNSVKKWPFSTFKTPKLCHFQDIYLKSVAQPGGGGGG